MEFLKKWAIALLSVIIAIEETALIGFICYLLIAYLGLWGVGIILFIFLPLLIIW